ncbi:acyl-CoA dehydrogenase family protein [Thermomonospora cellulosilytica]|uniref:Alkylation response protein AidB-like acyl-CoA dehydrogenase n=1 Tax=Thermomonospora cellulosilytica TaxID=1411118 RepID=A0A7W3R9B5_9ACTN|nr:acyl-CoA dehydrogenase family protein [Thermomonospora cellulosilytica]MBA9005158.1 alkylation response protein AidB-like acyl-CoA dehydrogenase [Thermomonospora cellulosilytica]
MSFVESEERRALREAVAELGAKYGPDYYIAKARSGEKTHELWNEAGALGYLGVNVPEEYGGGGGGIGDLAAVCEELAAAGCPLLLMVVSPAICATIIARSGTREQKEHWLPRFADGSVKMAFAITEPDAGSNAHRITTHARRDGDGWVLRGQKTFISGVDEADAVLFVARSADQQGNLRPSLFIVPTDAPGFTWTPIEMEIVSPEKQFVCHLDDVHLPYEALVGDEDGGLLQLFAGLNPERIMAAAMGAGIGRLALAKAVSYARERQVFKVPIGAHQGLAHPLAAAKVELELARLMGQKAAWLYDSGDDLGAGEAANMAKYAAAEAAIHCVDQAIQTHGGNGLTTEYGVGMLAGVVRLMRIAPVSREMILNYIAQHSLGLPKSY